MGRTYEEILKKLREESKGSTYTPVSERMHPRKIPSIKDMNNTFTLPIATKNFQKAKADFQTQEQKLSQNVSNRGIEVNRYSKSQLPTYKTIQSNAFNDWNLKKDYNAIKNMNLPKREDLNAKMYANYQKTDEFKQQQENVLKSKDNLGYAQYHYNKAKVENESVNGYDKSVGRLINGVLNFTDVGPRVRDGKGNYKELPSYQDLKESKVSDSYNTWIGKVLGDSAFQIGRMATSAVVNSIAPGLGSVEYFGSMYRDNYQQAINDGHDAGKALTYATISTATELATEKILGGTTKALTGGKASALNQGIANGLGKIMNNKGVINALSHAGAEATEEFVQEYIDKITRNITLGENNDILDPETFGDAMYSAVVGGLTGGIGAVGDSSLNIKNKSDLQQEKIAKQNKIDAFVNSASQYFDNSTESKNMIDTMSKVIKDKNYNITFDDKLISPNGNLVNAQINTNQNGEVDIRINPNSKRAAEFLLTHEITHAIETDSMKNLIIDYAIKNAEFNNALESLKQTYGVNDVSSEVVADISGQLFGNQEFINDLSMKEPNIFKRIYNKIIELANKITGNSNEALFLKDLKNKWETAYRTQNNNLNDIQYMMTGIKGVDNAIKKDSSNQFLRRNYEKANEMANNNINNEAIRRKTGWFRDSKGDWKFEISDNEAKIIKKIEPNKTYRLGDILEHSDLYEMYPNLKNNKVKFQDLSTYKKDGKTYISNGSFNRLTKLITINNNLIKEGNNRILDTLVHEIQHRIQKEEKFEHGTSIVFGTDKYQSNLGEMEARDTTKRRTLNYEKRINLPPVSSANKNIDNQKNKWYHFNEESTDVQENKEISPQYMENVSNGRELGRNSAEQRQGLDNSSFYLTNSKGEKIDISNIKETDYMKLFTFNRRYNKQTITAYRGVGEEGGTGIAMYGLGLYTTLDKKYASQYGTVYQVDNSLLPNNPLHFKTQNDFNIWEQELAKQLDIKKSELYGDYGIEQYLNKLGYDGLMIGTGKDTDLISFTNSAIKYSQDSDRWQEYLEKNYKPSGTRTDMQEIKIPTSKDVSKINMPATNSNKTLNPLEIANLSLEDANTTPKLPKVNRNRKGDGESKYWNNILEKTDMLNIEQKNKILSQDEVRYYDKVTNKESLDSAFERMNKNGEVESKRWFNKDSHNADSTDVAEGWILLKQYADNNDYDSMVEVAKKMRDIGSKAGQTVQAFNIMERMTPEGMVKYAQSELTEAYNKMVKNKSKEWIDKYRGDFDLKPDEVQFIMDNMKEVSKMEDGYDKRVKLAEIQKLMTDKLPPEKGASIKSWMRISMLFNPKTQVRNVAGNAIIAPVNYFGDLFSSYADKIIAKKTGVRTTGAMNVKAILEGMKKGAYESTNDYKKGISTKDMEGNRFEIGEAKSFDDRKLIGKSLNRVEGLLNYVMDAGDRVFSEASFENSLQNQMVLNNTTEITQEMIDIARIESLQRTWNDNNNYTKFVLDIRRMLNRIGTDKYGLGDILIPFAKTPANITKAIVDYSPAGLVTTLIQGNNLRKSLSNGQYTAKMQHQFVQTLGKATAGTMLYIAGLALAKAGITSGESDDDKDTANFLKNTLGISSYSIKLGGKTFTYDWAQPLAAPLSITANIVNSKNKETALLEAVVGNLDTAGSILLEQSFLTSLQEVLNDNDGVISGLTNQMLSLPARAVPTFSKQIADMVDGTQRTSFEYNKPIQSAINSIKAKIPGLSKTLAPSVDTMGREIKKYGGKNNLFNVFLNPANVNTENISESAEEIYRLYKQTGDKTIMPRVAPYYINQNNEKVILTSEQKAKYQKESGNIIEDSVQKLLKNDIYNKLSDVDKANVLKSIVDYSYNSAREEILGIPMSKEYNKINEYLDNGGSVHTYYLKKDEINYSLNNPGKYSVITQITDYDSYSKYKQELDKIREKSENKKQSTIEYINSLKMNIPQKAMLIKIYYPSFDSYDNEIISYINGKKMKVDEKSNILKELGFKVVNGRVY